MPSIFFFFFDFGPDAGVYEIWRRDNFQVQFDITKQDGTGRAD